MDWQIALLSGAQAGRACAGARIASRHGKVGGITQGREGQRLVADVLNLNCPLAVGGVGCAHGSRGREVQRGRPRALDLHYAAVTVRDEQIARAVHRQALGQTQFLDGNCRAAAGRHFHHAVVFQIPDEQIARSVHRHALGIIQSFAIHRRVDGNCRAAAGRNLHHAGVVGIHDKQIARAVHRQALGPMQPLAIHRRIDGNCRAAAGWNLHHAVIG